MSALLDFESSLVPLNHGLCQALFAFLLINRLQSTLHGSQLIKDTRLLGLEIMAHD